MIEMQIKISVEVDGEETEADKTLIIEPDWYVGTGRLRKIYITVPKGVQRIAINRDDLEEALKRCVDL